MVPFMMRVDCLRLGGGVANARSLHGPGGACPTSHRGFKSSLASNRLREPRSACNRGFLLISSRL